MLKKKLKTRKLKRHLLAAVLVMSSTAFIGGCKDKDKDEPGAKPSISGIEPSGALPGATATIKGQNFSPEKEKNTVRFDGLDATVKTATETQLDIHLPGGLVPGQKVQVTVAVGGQVSKPFPFVAGRPEPKISSIEPTEPLVGAILHIKGTNFGELAEGCAVRFGDTQAEVTQWADKEIGLKVPVVKAGTQKIKITAPHGESTALSCNVRLREMGITGFDNQRDYAAGDTLVIRGKALGTNTGDLTMWVNGKQQEVLWARDSSAAVRIAPKTFAGKLEVEKDDGMNPPQKLGAQQEVRYRATYQVSDFHGPTAKETYAWGIDLDAEGNVYFSAYNHVVKLDKNGELVDTIIKIKNGDYIYDMNVTADGSVYATESRKGLLLRLEGRRLDTLVNMGGENDMYLAESPGGGVYFSSRQNNMVYRINGDKKEEHWGIREPENIAFDPQGNLYIKNGESKHVKKLSPDKLASDHCGSGTDSPVGGMAWHRGARGLYAVFYYKRSWGWLPQGGQYTKKGDLKDSPRSLAVDGDGNLLITYKYGIKKVVVQ